MHVFFQSHSCDIDLALFPNTWNFWNHVCERLCVNVNERWKFENNDVSKKTTTEIDAFGGLPGSTTVGPRRNGPFPKHLPTQKKSSVRLFYDLVISSPHEDDSIGSPKYRGKNVISSAAYLLW